MKGRIIIFAVCWIVLVVSQTDNQLYNLPAKFHNLWHRNEIIEICEEIGLKTGVEVGVQRGVFSREVLKLWKSCDKYYLVDLWKQQDNYLDKANVANDVQERYYQEALKNVAEFNKTVPIKAASVVAAKDFADSSLDFVYLDARHDYCGVEEDILAWYPKLSLGGLMAGHDYLTAPEALRLSGMTEHWELCQNGSTLVGAVKGAVNDFAAAHGIRVFRTKDKPPSWFYSLKGRKPVSPKD